MNRNVIVGVVLALVMLASAPAAASAHATDGTAPTMDDGTLEQPPERWNETYDTSDQDEFAAIVETDDGYLLVGDATEKGNSDGLVVKVSASGETQWQKTVGSSKRDRLFAATRTADGGYLLAGHTKDAGRSTIDGWVLKMSAGGDVQWQKTYGNEQSESFWTMQSTGDGYVLGGYRLISAGDRDAWAMKIGSDGSKKWEKTYSTPRSGAHEYIQASTSTSDGGTLFVGQTEGSSADPADGWMFEVNADGQKKWQETYGTQYEDDMWGVARAHNGGYVIAGSIGTKDRDTDGLLLKISEEGVVEWENTYGGVDKDDLYGVTATRDGGYLVTGMSLSEGTGSGDAWIVKTAADGATQWTDTFGGESWDRFWPVVETADGGYLVAGESSSSGPGRDGLAVRLGGAAMAKIQDSVPEEPGITVPVRDSRIQQVVLLDESIVQGGTLSVDQLSSLPGGLPGEPLYALDVTLPSDVTNQTGTVRLTVDEDAVSEMGVDATDLHIVQQTNGSWTVLDTRVVDRTDGVITLEAEASTFTTFAVTAVDAPTATIAIEGDSNVLEPGQSVTLDASESTVANGSVESYEWTVGGETRTGETTDVSFDEAGIYDVSLTVTDRSGLSTTNTKELVVNDEPTATVDVPTSVDVGTSTTLSVEVTDSVGNATVTWKFPDGEKTGRTIEHAFGSAGTYDVQIVVEDEYGASVTKTATVEVMDAPQTNNDGGQPGFGLVVALLALAGAALLTRRR